MSPLSRILAGLLALLALIGAFFFGLFVLALAVGLAVLAWLALSLRMWWLRRHSPGRTSGSTQRGTSRDGSARRRESEVIEADYEVISRHEDD